MTLFDIIKTGSDMKNCLFCQIVNKEIPSEKIWEDDEFVALLDVKPINDGHLLLIPKKHTEYLFDLDDESYINLFKTVRKIAKPLRTATRTKKVGIIIEGFGVPHVHVHLVPINSGNELDPSRAHSVSAEKLAKTALEIRKNLH